MRHFIIALFVCGPAIAEEPLPGHSHQGHAFNEGPRQEATLFQGTGKVHLPITTDWEFGQAFFDQGLGQLHGFWYYEAERSFRQIAANDPECAMAYWGMAMANWENPKRAKDFIEKATALLDQLTPHEQQYVKAQANFLDDQPKDLKRRSEELLRDLEDLIHDHPNDLEAKAFLACRIWQFSQKGISIPSHEAVDALLQQILTKAPLHPAHHYRIHLWDKRKAARALDSAAKLGFTAPAIAHMWHMPGHIYSKLNRFEDAVWHQQASARIDHAHMIEQKLLPDQIHNYAHNNEWLARNWVHLGNAPDAVAMAKSLLANPRHPKLNTLEGKAHSYRYGRDRLIEILEKFELWDKSLLLAGTTWLEPLATTRDEIRRQRLIGLAKFHLNQKDHLKETIAKVEAIKEIAAEDHKKAQDKARKDAGDKPEKELEGIVKNAGKQQGQQIDMAQKAIDELNGCLAALDGDQEAALKALEKSKRPDFAKALQHLALGDHKKAAELSKSAVEKGKNQTLPLAARIQILHALDRHDDARKAFDQLRQNSSQLDLTSPPFARLAPIARAYELPDDWTLPYEVPADFGERPKADSLGPLHWEPPSAPDFNHSDLYHGFHKLSQYSGKPLLLIHYLGHSCLHCAEQLNAIADRINDFEKAGLTVVAISTDDILELKKSQENYNADGKEFPFLLLADPKMDSFHAYGTYDDFEKQALHGTFLISPNGRILWSDIAADPFMDLDFLLQESRRLLKLHGR